MSDPHHLPGPLHEAIPALVSGLKLSSTLALDLHDHIDKAALMIRLSRINRQRNPLHKLEHLRFTRQVPRSPLASTSASKELFLPLLDNSASPERYPDHLWLHPLLPETKSSHDSKHC